MSAQSKVSAAKQAELKTRVASAWTLAKTMLPSAPPAVQYKFAQSLLANSTRALTAALKQTAVNAHYTRIAEQIQQVFKKDMNDLLENPEKWSSEVAAIKSEYKKAPKDAAAKNADDRSAAGPQPAKYDDGRHGSEPNEMDGDHAAERPALLENPDKVDNGKMATAKKACAEGCSMDHEHVKEASAKKACAEGCKEDHEHVKEASAKKACGEGCKGCSECKKEASTKVACGKDCEGCSECKDKKEAALKAAKAKSASCGNGCNCSSCKVVKRAAFLASAKVAASHGDDCDCKDCKATKKASHSDGCDCGFCKKMKSEKGEKKEAAAKKADDTPAEAEGEVAAGEHEDNAGDALAEAGKELEHAGEHEEEANKPEAEGAADMEAPAEGDKAGEEFDPEKTNLQEAVDQVKSDIEQLEEAIQAFDGEAGDMTDMVPDETEGEMPDMMGDEMDMMDLANSAEGMPGEGQELNMDDIFNDEGMADKVSSLNDEHDPMGAEAALEVSFFEEPGPDDSAEMEHALDQVSEEEFSLPEMFSMKGASRTSAMDELLGGKTAKYESDIVNWGELADYFGDDAGNGKEVRDTETDHEEDIFEAILNDEKQPTRNDKRDTHPNLKPDPEQKKVSAVKPTKAAPVAAAPKTASPRKLKPAAAAPLKKEAGITDGNLAGLLFPDDSDFM